MTDDWVEHDELLDEIKQLQQERDTLRDQLKGVGITPYLDRMKQLAEERDDARKRVTEWDAASVLLGTHRHCDCPACKHLRAWLEDDA